MKGNGNTIQLSAADAAARTLEAIRSGASVVVQAVLQKGRWYGGSMDELIGEVAYHLNSRNRAVRRRWLRSA